MMRELHTWVSLPVKAEFAYAWHEHDSAFNRLSPAWESTRMLRTDGLREGGRAVIALPAPVGTLKWHAEHFNVVPGKEFSDRQLQGPFKCWRHRHEFEAVSEQNSLLHDRVQYELPLSPLSDIFAGWFVRQKLSAMFAYRHKVLLNDLAFWGAWQEKTVKRILVTGSRGLIGRELTAFLRQGGYEVIGLSREASDSANTVQWNLTESRPTNAGALQDGKPLDAVVHLAGEGIADKRWTSKQKENLARSRVEATHNLIAGLKELGLSPKVFISASGVGIYGDRGDEILTESSSPGEGFLGELACAWEKAAQQAENVFSARSVQLRMSTVLTPRGGALAKMLPAFKFGAGGRLGSGKQWMSWVALDDVLYAIVHTLETESIRGAVNLVSPQPVTNLEFTKTLANVLNRPAVLPAPAFALKLALGEMANELLLCSQRAIPEALCKAGFEFRHADLHAALKHMLGKNQL
jgi:uncharacterized protein (TIGR01777 family)